MDELLAIALEEGHLDPDVLARFGINGPDQIAAFCDRVARYVATEYASERMSWEDGDIIMNAICFLISTHLERPSLRWAWDVYLAFDAGEYGDKLGDDATRPLIKELVGGSA